MNLFERLLSLFEHYYPAFLAGLRLGQWSRKRTEKENANLKLEIKAGQDEKAIATRNAGLTDDELRAEIIGSSPRTK